MCSRHTTRVIASSAKDVRNLIESCPAFTQYEPPTWLPGPHLNTIGSALLRAPPLDGKGLTYAARTTLPVSHDGTVAIDYLTIPRKGQPVLLFLHGLTGGSHEVYLQWMVHHASAAGFCSVVMNARGCGFTTLSSPRCFSAAWTEDVRAAVKHVRAIIGPETPLFAIGYSLGAGILAKFVAEEGDGCDLAGACSVAAAYDLNKSSAALESGLNRVIYSGLLTRGLQRYYEKHSAVFAAVPWADAKSIMAARTVRDFDRLVIVPQFGYRDVVHYYSDGSAGPLLHRIRVPFLALNAADDPITSVRGLLDAAPAIEASGHVIAVVTPAGGHVAWATNPTWTLRGPRFGLAWDNVAALQFFTALLDRAGYARDARAPELEVAVHGALPPRAGSSAGPGAGPSMGGVDLRL